MILSFASKEIWFVKVAKNGKESTISPFASRQHEADGCLLMHTAHASNVVSHCGLFTRHRCCCSMCTLLSKLSELWFKTDIGYNIGYININKFVQKLVPTASFDLLAFNCLTGCDSTSYFSGRG